MGKLFAVIFTTALAAQVSFAEVIKLPVGSQAADKQHLVLPNNGQSRDSVEAQFGAPEAVNNAVGEPPISSWQYRDYIVYFEYDKVLHSVLKHSAKNLDSESETE
ncbi:MAG: hypothetical protein KBT88_02970 [Gammaproteobacteria bacterium]|nr:hypothetical protein [Gammaproteobacteria bacterium]MBQ0838720.1 hypothetical protein [Gammaproteobacteria bacterium]